MGTIACTLLFVFGLKCRVCIGVCGPYLLQLRNSVVNDHCYGQYLDLDDTLVMLLTVGFYS